MVAAKLALKFIGNASVQTSQDRRKRAFSDMNYKLTDLADRDDIFEETPPMLFGDSLAKEANKREEQLRWLQRAAGRGRQHDFLHGHSQTARQGGVHHCPGVTKRVHMDGHTRVSEDT